MHKILICPDVHFASNSSIIQSRGERYSTRIENCIASINWLEDLAIKENCSSIFYLGDFLDKDIIKSEEATAIRDINFSKLPHFIITGNHEISLTNNQYSSVGIFDSISNFNVINSYFKLESENCVIHLIPYLYDCPELLTDIINVNLGDTRKQIVLSHNDIKGIEMGKFISVSGIDLKSINDSCDLFINGHIHNSSWVSNKIFNLGILTGKDFNEDAFRYEHHIMIIDLDNCNLEIIENPHAFNFYKIEINGEKDLSIFKILKNNAVLSIHCKEIFLPKVKELTESSNTIVGCRIIVVKDLSIREEIPISASLNPSNDHLSKFNDFCIERFGNSDLVLSELSKVCG